ncbi:uncharacterized protein LOC142351848 isoform X1 [Convolutriloba macropyga]|uniref:uncharacterized protein LOC142351848 isoform X1 n=1 Tax=Convolutriloba macropyga TaxID=536237 RepID=UPI003F5223C3
MVVPNFITMGAAKEEENDGRSESIEMREIEVQVLESDDGASGADGVESLQTSLEHSGASTLSGPSKDPVVPKGRSDLCPTLGRDVVPFSAGRHRMCEHHVTRRNDDDSYDESWEETDVEERRYVCACGRDMTQFEKTVNKNNLSREGGMTKMKSWRERCLEPALEHCLDMTEVLLESCLKYINAHHSLFTTMSTFQFTPESAFSSSSTHRYEQRSPEVAGGEEDLRPVRVERRRATEDVLY